MTTEEKVPDDLRIQFAKLADRVGLKLQTDDSENRIPQGAQLWTTDFAVLLMCPVPIVAPNELEAAAASATNWILERLNDEEKKGRLLDGYAILALAVPPDNPTRNATRRITNDTQVCRKHVIWPESDHGWQKHLWAITILGLPDSKLPQPSVALVPSLPPGAEDALKLYEELDSYESAAQALMDKVQADRSPSSDAP